MGASPPAKPFPCPGLGQSSGAPRGRLRMMVVGLQLPVGAGGSHPHPWGFTGQGWISGSALAGGLPAAPSELLLAKSRFLLFPA